VPHDVDERLTRVFREVLADPGLELRDDLTAASVPTWDSLAHVGLMFSIESEFGIVFTDREMSGFDTVGELRRAVEGKVA
jgi:acyl carrier protein